MFLSSEGPAEQIMDGILVREAFNEFIPILNNEHKGYAWSKLESYPKPLHPGVFNTFRFEEILDKLKTIEQIMCSDIIRDV